MPQALLLLSCWFSLDPRSVPSVPTRSLSFSQKTIWRARTEVGPPAALSFARYASCLRTYTEIQGDVGRYREIIHGDMGRYREIASCLRT